MNCLFDECTARNKKQKKKKCCLFMRAGKENENAAPLTEIHRYLTFDFEYGEFFETYNGLDGFDDAFIKVVDRFQLPKDSLTRLVEMNPYDPPLTIWEKKSTKEKNEY
ncbi:MAG: hypothetical protein GY820_29055 [Gammaproteobacteria bacterium]|nr:hypothetical protein [Gammaproteobacteria bacterium]